MGTLHVEVITLQEKLTPTFQYQDFNFIEIEKRRNPAYTNNFINHMGIMADVMATLSEHATWNQTTQHKSCASYHLLT